MPSAGQTARWLGEGVSSTYNFEFGNLEKKGKEKNDTGGSIRNTHNPGPNNNIKCKLSIVKSFWTNFDAALCGRYQGASVPWQVLARERRATGRAASCGLEKANFRSEVATFDSVFRQIPLTLKDVAARRLPDVKMLLEINISGALTAPVMPPITVDFAAAKKSSRRTRISDSHRSPEIALLSSTASEIQA